MSDQGSGSPGYSAYLFHKTFCGKTCKPGCPYDLTAPPLTTEERSRADTQAKKEKDMTVKKPKRLRIRRRQETVDQKMIDMLVAAQLKEHTEKLLAIERNTILKQGEARGFSAGERAGITKGIAQATQKAEKDANTRVQEEVKKQNRAAKEIACDVARTIRHYPATVYADDGYTIPEALRTQARTRNLSVQMYAFAADMTYEYHAVSLSRLFKLTIWKTYREVTDAITEIAIDFKFSEEHLRRTGGVDIIELLCQVAIEGARHVDAELMCAWMAEWVTTTRARDGDGPTVHVPRGAIDKARARFRAAVGLPDYD